MSSKLSAFEQVEQSTPIWVATTAKLRCSAVKLEDGSLCIYSPVAGLTEAALETLNSIGPVSYLLAPNHYHNKAIAEYHEAFPSAKLICSENAKPRLEKKTGLLFETADMLSEVLPGYAELLEPEGLKTGEIWIDLKINNHRIVVVTDAFKGVSMKGKIYSSKIELLGTFPNLGLKDRSKYLDWIKAQSLDNSHLTIVPCHGAIAAGTDVGKKAIDLVTALQK